MNLHFRQLTLDDRHAYLTLMLAAYAPIRALGIHFDAATADLDRVTRHLQQHAVYGLFADDRLASSLTLRFPGDRCPARSACRISAGSAPTRRIRVSSWAARCWTGWKRIFCGCS